MTTVLNHYLENLRGKLRIGFSEEKEVISELEAHIEDRLQDLQEAGLSEEEATETCLGMLGSAKLIARQIYEAHSQGTWKQALIAAMPHLLFGVLFVLNWWQHLVWLVAVLTLVLGTTIYGWWHGKPTWVFPWLGYSLLPVVVVGLLLLYLPKGWSWVTITLYIPLASWWIYYVIVQTIKRDWLFSSVMLLPIPIIVGWALAVEPEGEFTEHSLQRIHIFAPWIGLSFLALALTVVTFIRLRQRWFRIALLFISGILSLTMIAYYADGRLSLPAFLVLILAMWGLFLIPALLERRLRNEKRRFRKSISSLSAILNASLREVFDAKGSYRH